MLKFFRMMKARQQQRRSSKKKTFPKIAAYLKTRPVRPIMGTLQGRDRGNINIIHILHSATDVTVDVGTIADNRSWRGPRTRPRLKRRI